MTEPTTLKQILQGVTRPARYTGGEWNAVHKDWDTTPIRVVLSYPDVYEVGMSNLALPILYDILNRQPDVLAERVFAPWVDMAARLRESKLPLFSLESRRPLSEFDIIGFSLGYELTYTNVLEMLDLAGIPVLAAERSQAHPLVIAGGSGALNPEPMSDFFDLFVIGEAEEAILELIATFRQWKASGASRTRFLERAAGIEGVYVPSLYRVHYNADGTVAAVTPTPPAPAVVKRRTLDHLPPPVTRPVVPFIETIHDRAAIEIQRGCTRGCRFCQAGIIYRPVRVRPPAEVLKAARELLDNCGYSEVSLVSLSTSDYPGIESLVAELSSQLEHTALSLPSLYISSFTTELVEALSARKKIGLTFAPEAGTERLRRIINKEISGAGIETALASAFARGWTSLKLYFMLGLPGETTEDVAGIVALVESIRALGRRVAGQTPQLRVNLSTFAPKPHTPFQWVAQIDEAGFNARLGLLQEGLRRRGTRLSWHDPRSSRLEAALSRGDRRVGRAIYRAWRLGSTFDAWDEHLRFENWQQAFREEGLEMDFYARRERPRDEVLPWDHIDVGVSREFLEREYRRALEGLTTPDCRQGPCSACGLQDSHPACRQKSAGRS